MENILFWMNFPKNNIVLPKKQQKQQKQQVKIWRQEHAEKRLGSAPQKYVATGD